MGHGVTAYATRRRLRKINLSLPAFSATLRGIEQCKIKKRWVVTMLADVLSIPPRCAGHAPCSSDPSVVLSLFPFKLCLTRMNLHYPGSTLSTEEQAIALLGSGR
jgi:hypothetical protein